MDKSVQYSPVSVPERKGGSDYDETARKRRLYPGRAGCYAGHSEHPVCHRCPEPARVYPPVAVPQERVLRKDHVSVRGIRADVLPHRRRMGVVLQTGEGRGRAQPVVRRGGRGAEKAQRPHLRHPSGCGRVCLGRAVGRRQSRRRVAFAGYLRQKSAERRDLHRDRRGERSCLLGLLRHELQGTVLRLERAQPAGGAVRRMAGHGQPRQLRPPTRGAPWLLLGAGRGERRQSGRGEAQDHLDQSGQRRNALAGLVEQRQSAEQGERIL